VWHAVTCVLLCIAEVWAVSSACQRDTLRSDNKGGPRAVANPNQPCSRSLTSLLQALHKLQIEHQPGSCLALTVGSHAHDLANCASQPEKVQPEAGHTAAAAFYRRIPLTSWPSRDCDAVAAANRRSLMPLPTTKMLQRVQYSSLPRMTMQRPSGWVPRSARTGHNMTQVGPRRLPG
jgi:hypothetical protein